MTAKEVGERVNLTLVERSELNIRTITAVDATPDEVRRTLRAKKKDRDRLYAAAAVKGTNRLSSTRILTAWPRCKPNCASSPKWLVLTIG